MKPKYVIPAVGVVVGVAGWALADVFARRLAHQPKPKARHMDERTPGRTAAVQAALTVIANSARPQFATAARNGLRATSS